MITKYNHNDHRQDVHIFSVPDRFYVLYTHRKMFLSQKPNMAVFLAYQPCYLFFSLFCLTKVANCNMQN